jgi:hypothetical protein
LNVDGDEILANGAAHKYNIPYRSEWRTINHGGHGDNMFEGLLFQQ